MVRLDGLSCRYNPDDIEIAGSPTTLARLADLLEKGIEEIALPSSVADQFYTQAATRIITSDSPSKLKVTIAANNLLIEGSRQARLALAKSIWNLSSDRASEPGRHLHLEPVEGADDCMDAASWPLVVIIGE